MLAHSLLQQQSTNRHLCGGILAVCVLWLLAVCSPGSIAHAPAAGVDREGISPSVNQPLHVNGEYSITLKRFFARNNDQPKAPESTEPVWLLPPTQPVAASPLPFSASAAFFYSSCNCLQRLQTLNTPRAPPFA